MNLKTHVYELLSAYLDEACTAEEKERLEQHLDDCPECRKELAELRTTVRLVKELNYVEAPQEIIANVEERLRKRSFFAWWKLQPVPSLVVVMVVFLMAITVNKYSYLYKSRQKPFEDTVSGTFDKGISSPRIKLPESIVLTPVKKKSSELQRSPVPTGAVANTVSIRRGNSLSPKKLSALSRPVIFERRGEKNRPKDAPVAPAPYVVEMEVPNMDEGLRELINLADAYRAQPKQVSEEENDVFLEIQGRDFTDFVNELHHIGKVSYGFVPEEKMEESTPTAHSSASRVIRIKFNQNR